MNNNKNCSSKEYLDKLLSQIRWAKAVPMLKKEINSHIEDQKEAYVKEGFEEAEAENMAVLQMGDPIEAGMSLDRIHRPKMDVIIIAISILFVFIGIAFQYSFLQEANAGYVNFYTRQIFWAIISIAVMIATYFMDYTIFGRYPKFIFLMNCISVVISMNFLPIVNGRAVYVVYLFMIFPLTYAGVIYSMRNKGYSGIIISLILLLLIVYIGTAIGSFTALFIVCAVSFIVLLCAILKDWFGCSKRLCLITIFGFTALLIVFMLFAIIKSDYFMYRIISVFLPQNDPVGRGYVAVTIQKIISNSVFIGQGHNIFENDLSRSVFEVLPDAYTDFLLTSVIYKFGWAVFLLVILVFCGFIAYILYKCVHQKNMLGFFISISVCLIITFEFITYIVANLGLIILSPLVLPFVSYGGRALVTNMFFVGVLLSTIRTGFTFSDKNILVKDAADHILEYKDGKIIFDISKLNKF